MDVNTTAHRHREPESPRPRMGCWGGFSCLKPRKGGKRVVPAARLADGSAPSAQWAVTRQPASGTQTQFPSLSPSLLAPPSSPASFQNSAVHSSAQSPSLHVVRQVETTTAMMFQTGPYAHETALVTPPVFSTFTTAPSTAPFTPPPELAHITTPSSPEVPFAQLLTSSLNGKGPVRQQSDTTTASSTAPFTPPPELAQATTPCSPEVPFAQLLTSSYAANNTQSDATTPSSTAPITPPPEPAQGPAVSSPDVPFAQFLTSTFSVKSAPREPDVAYSASPFASPEYCIGESQVAFERRSGSLFAHPRPSASVIGAPSSLPEHLPVDPLTSPASLATLPSLQPETWVELEVRSTGMSTRSSQEMCSSVPSEPETSLFTICHGDDLLRPDYSPQFFDELDELPNAAVSQKNTLENVENVHLGRLTKVAEEDDCRTEEDYLVLEGFHLDSNYHGGVHANMSMDESGDQCSADLGRAKHVDGASPAAPNLNHCQAPAVSALDDSDCVACDEAGGSVMRMGTQVNSPRGQSAVATQSGSLSCKDGIRAEDVLKRPLVVTSLKTREESSATGSDNVTRRSLSKTVGLENSEDVSPRYEILLCKCEELSLALQMAEAREREALELLDETQKKASSLEESVARLSVELSQQELAFLDLQSKHFAHLGVASPSHILSPGLNLVA